MPTTSNRGRTIIASTPRGDGNSILEALNGEYFTDVESIILTGEKKKKPKLKGKTKKKKTNDKKFPCFKCKKKFDKKTLIHIKYDKRNHHVCPECLEEFYFRCYACGTIYSVDDYVNRLSENTGEIYCEECFDEMFEPCSRCGDETYCEDIREVYDEENDETLYLCNRCFDRHNQSHIGDKRWDTIISFKNSKKFKENKSKRYVGIEIEVERNKGFSIANLKKECHDFTCCKGDNSLENGDEITLNPANGDLLFERIRKVCKCLVEGNYTAEKSCGLHIHIDTRGLDKEQLRNIFLCYNVFERYFFEMVEPSRRDNQYCYSIERRKKELQLNDIMNDFYQYITCSNQHDRYYWTNLTKSFGGRNSLEIRLHHGTLNAEEIINWVKIHLSLVEWALDKDIKRIIGLKSSIKTFFNIINDNTLRNYIQRKRKKFNCRIPRETIKNVKLKFEKGAEQSKSIGKFYWKPDYISKRFFDIINNIKEDCDNQLKDKTKTKTKPQFFKSSKLRYMRGRNQYSNVCIDKFNQILKYIIDSNSIYLNNTFENSNNLDKTRNTFNNDMNRFKSYIYNNLKGFKKVFGYELERIKKEIKIAEKNEKTSVMSIDMNGRNYKFSRNADGVFDKRVIIVYCSQRIRENWYNNEHHKKMVEYFNKTKGRKSTKCVKYK